MNKKQKKMLIRIVIAAVLVVAFSLIPMKRYPEKSGKRYFKPTDV